MTADLEALIEAIYADASGWGDDVGKQVGKEVSEVLKHLFDSRVFPVLRAVADVEGHEAACEFLRIVTWKMTSTVADVEEAFVGEET